jgi:hypothetical protein
VPFKSAVLKGHFPLLALQRNENSPLTVDDMIMVINASPSCRLDMPRLLWTQSGEVRLQVLARGPGDGLGTGTGGGGDGRGDGINEAHCG